MKHSREEMLEKAKERGYDLWAQSGNKNWYSLVSERNRMNLQIWIDTEEFELNYRKGTIRITTEKCGSFMMDDHFKRFEKDMRAILFDLL